MVETTSSSAASASSSQGQEVEKLGSRKFFRVDVEQEEEHIQKSLADLSDLSEDPTKEKLLEYIRNSIIGDDEVFKSPYGYRKITYCDYIASGRSLSFIEDFIRKEVLSTYANTHTTTSITGRQSTLFRYEARELIMNQIHAAKFDRLVFTGSGSTAALNKLVHMLNIKHEVSSGKKVVVFVGPYEHHTNLLPWRESGATVVNIQEDESGQIDLKHLESQLQVYAGTSNKGTMIGAFSAASNVTGILSDTIKITALLHKYGALSIWDYACAAPYVKIDMNPVVEGYERNLIAKDAIIISPHKFIGGVETPGILIAKKQLFINKVPECPGGGTVFFVTENDHRYLKKQYEREEGGTPSIVGSIRAGLVFQLKGAVGEEVIEKKEHELFRKALDSLKSNDNIVILGNTEVPRLAIISFMIKHGNSWLHYNYVSTLLNDLFGIQVRGGCACAGPYGQKLLGIDHPTSKKFEEQLLADDDHEFLRPGFVRLSLNYFTDETTLQYVLDAMHFVAKEGWKFLPHYTFYPETGEWVHNNNKKFLTRKWLHSISYKSGKMEYRQQVNMKVTTKELRKYMEEANKLLSSAIEEFEKKAYTVPDQLNLLPPNAEKLRWFIYPCEALWELRGDTTVQQRFLSCPVRPGRVSSRALSEEPTAVAPVEPAPQPTQSVPEKTVQQQSAAAVEQALPEQQEQETLIGSSATTAKINKKKLWPKVDKKLVTNTKKAIFEFGMLKEGDRVLLGLSGGKDSLTMLHVLHYFQVHLPFKFSLGACTVDPQTDAYDPSPLKKYLAELGIPYFFESQNIIEGAKECGATSICAWCSRMKRGILYNTARREGYNVLVLAQHLDDLAESFMMSVFFNGYLRTQKVNYLNDTGDIRVIRPFVYVREKDIKKWAREVHLPIINENCPACFEIPKERARMKTLLSQQEHMYPNLFYSFQSALKPLMQKDMEKPNGTNKKFKTSFKNIKAPKLSSKMILGEAAAKKLEKMNQNEEEPESSEKGKNVIKEQVPASSGEELLM